MLGLACYLVSGPVSFVVVRLVGVSLAKVLAEERLRSPLVVLFSFTDLRKSRFIVDNGVVSWPVGPPPKPRWEGWEGETDAMAVRS